MRIRPNLFYESRAQGLADVTMIAAPDLGLPCHVKSVVRAWIHVKFDGNAGPRKASRIFKIFLKKEIERYRNDKNRRQSS